MTPSPVASEGFQLNHKTVSSMDYELLTILRAQSATATTISDFVGQVGRSPNTQ